MTDLQTLIEHVQRDHEQRLTACWTLPLERKPWKTRPRPKTAIISLAAQAKELEIQRTKGWGT